MAQSPTPDVLSPLESKVMDLLWAHGEMDSEEVRARLRPDHDLTDSTVRTLLRRVEAKGFIRHRKEGRRYVYRAAVSVTRAGVRSVRDTIRRFFRGSPEMLLVGMVEEGILDAEQLEELAARVARAKRP